MTRALVLSGGGLLGIAWESGLLAGFARGGIDLGAADYILGTSAGAVVGARLAAGERTAGMAEALLNAPAEAPLARLEGRPSAEAFAQMAAMMEETQRGTRNPADVRRELGRLALAAETVREAEFLARIGRNLAGATLEGWPSDRYACAAVDAEDGAFQLWEAASGVDLLPAVAASCAVPGVYPPVSVNGRRYMDGGARSLANADLAAGYEVVALVFVHTPGLPPWAASQLAEEVELLKATGSTVAVITPDEGSAAALGLDLMDAGRQPEAARAGLAQGLAQAEVLKQVWG